MSVARETSSPLVREGSSLRLREQSEGQELLWTLCFLTGFAQLNKDEKGSVWSSPTRLPRAASDLGAAALHGAVY
jgi:hypothetical protein